MYKFYDGPPFNRELVYSYRYNPDTGYKYIDEWSIHETGYRVKSSSIVKRNGVVLNSKYYNSDGKLMEQMSYDPDTGYRYTDRWQIHETGYRVKSSSYVEKNGVVIHKKLYDSDGDLIHES